MQILKYLSLKINGFKPLSFVMAHLMANLNNLIKFIFTEYNNISYQISRKYNYLVDRIFDFQF